MKASIFSLTPAFLVIALFVLSCKKDISTETADLNISSAAANALSQKGFVENDMVMFWNEKASQVMDVPVSPPAQARFFAIIQIAVHDALNSIKPKFETYALKNVHEKNADPNAAIASAAYWTIKGMNLPSANPSFTFPNLSQLDGWYSQSLLTIPDGESKQLGLELGKQAADAIIANRSTDNFLAANVQIAQPDGVAPGEYRSTLPFSLPGMPPVKALHQWGTQMAPFVTESNSQFRPVAPYSINSIEYLNDFNEVKSKGARINHNRSADEDEIGRFWVERSSIGWNRFARNVVSSKKVDAWKTARLFALLHTAMADAISGTFEAKYHYFYWRPETAIRLGDADGNSNTAGDADWLPSYTEGPNPNPAMNMYTPPIPDYPSAHASFGGAAAEILKLFFSSDKISINQASPMTPGVVRQYSSIAQAARDNSLSRIYVGYHFRNAALKGEQQGKEIAGYVFGNSFREAVEHED